MPRNAIVQGQAHSQQVDRPEQHRGDTTISSRPPITTEATDAIARLVRA